jgi:uncharacterized membrane protein
MGQTYFINSYKYMGRWSVTAEALSIIALIGTVVFIIINYAELPESIPRHFDAAGNPDAYGSRPVIWVLPAVMTMLYLTLTGIFAINPEYLNFPIDLDSSNRAKQIRMAYSLIQWLKLIILLFLSYTVVETFAIATDPKTTAFSAPSLWIFLGLVFGSIAVYLYGAFKNR